ncbi:hypothetical protein V5O48_014431 [Marasmius crinis-equi]|uniref:HNH nuclease domain-containing protein n=1 Tax=Marasmius crinis-equi TaxID=585013 RepID=A0ABR3EXD4_9AGAR
MSPLPENHPNPTPSISRAYQECRRIEQTLQDQYHEQTSIVDLKRLINIRILGYLIREGPTDTAKQNVAQAVLELEREGDTEGMIQLGEYYDKWFMRPFRNGDTSPDEDLDFGRRDLLSEEEEILAEGDDYASLSLDERRNATAKAHPRWLRQPKNYCEAKEAALIRDNWRCVLSKTLDSTSLFRFGNSGSDTLSLLEAERQLRVACTTCYHIIPATTQPATFAVFEQFGYPGLGTALSGEKIHSLKNVITINRELREFLAQLRVCLVPIPDEPHTYHLEYPLEKTNTVPLVERLVFEKTWGVPRKIHLTRTTDFPELECELPCPELLALHAVSCKLAYLSGLTEYLVQVEKMMLLHTNDREEPVSGDLLAAKLMDIAE